MATRTPDGVGGSNDVWCGASLDREGAVAPEEGERVEASVPSPTLAARVAYFIEWLGNTVALWWLNSDHKLQQQRVRFIAGALFLVAMLVCSVSASAFTGLDPLMAQYEGMGSGFMAGSLNLAIALSGGLLACVLLYRFVKSIAHANGNLRSVLPGGLVLLLETYVPWQIVLWTPSLLGNLMNLARTISNKIGVTPITSPDTIVSTGINLGFGTFGNIMTTYLAAIPKEAAQLPPCPPLDPLNPLKTLGCQVGHWAQIGAATASAEHNLTTVMVVAGVLCGVIIYVFGMLAAELLMATIQVSITIPMGAWTLGFTGTPLQGAAGNVWGAIMGAIARWLTVFVLVTVALQTATLIGNSLAVGFKPTLPQNLGQGFSDLLGTNFGWFRPVCGAAIGCLVLMKITSKCADLAESVMSGRSVMQGASAVSGAVGGVGSSIGGAAIGAVRGGPMGAAAGAMSGARSAASSTLNRMK